MTARLTVSIVTPSFEQARFIEATLRSVADQDYPGIEHIVMDGGSTDGTVAILERWANDHPIVWRSAPDGGQADAIQRGIEMSHGDIVAWLNSDDVYLDERVISDVVALFDAGAQLVSGSGWYIDEAGARIRRIPVYPDRITHDAARYVDWFLQPATFVRRELFVACPLDTSLHYGFDWDFFVRVTALAPVTPTERAIAGYRVHGSAKTRAGGLARQRELLEITRRYQGRSGRSLLLSAVVAIRGLAEHLPAPATRVVDRGLNGFARATWRFTGGRGIQY